MLDRKTKGAYREAAGYIADIRALLVENGKDREFAEYISEIRTKHRAKKNLMIILDKKKW